MRARLLSRALRPERTSAPSLPAALRPAAAGMSAQCRPAALMCPPLLPMCMQVVNIPQNDVKRGEVRVVWGLGKVGLGCAAPQCVVRVTR